MSNKILQCKKSPFLYAVLLLFSVNLLGRANDKMELPQFKLDEVYLGTQGFVFPKAKTASGDDPESLPTSVATYIICELNYSLHNGKTDNTFLQHVFGVASVDESDPHRQNNLTRLAKQMGVVNSKRAVLKLNGIIQTKETSTWRVYELLFDVQKSRYKKGILTFSIIQPKKHEEGGFETELSMGTIYLSF